MGAQEFTTYNPSPRIQEAFDAARANAEWDHGHSGYTGSIAEKSSFVLIGEAETKADALAMAEQLLEADDPRTDNKWGPAGAIQINTGGYVFFGWASS